MTTTTGKRSHCASRAKAAKTTTTTIPVNSSQFFVAVSRVLPSSSLFYPLLLPLLVLVAAAAAATATHRQMLDIFTVSVWQMSTLLYNDVAAVAVALQMEQGRGGARVTIQPTA